MSFCRGETLQPIGRIQGVVVGGNQQRIHRSLLQRQSLDQGQQFAVRPAIGHQVDLKTHPAWPRRALQAAQNRGNANKAPIKQIGLL